jgi:hypothetical protein
VRGGGKKTSGIGINPSPEARHGYSSRKIGRPMVVNVEDLTVAITERSLAEAKSDVNARIGMRKKDSGVLSLFITTT